jgi:hypothetical protein
MFFQSRVYYIDRLFSSFQRPLIARFNSLGYNKARADPAALGTNDDQA